MLVVSDAAVGCLFCSMHLQFFTPGCILGEPFVEIFDRIGEDVLSLLVDANFATKLVLKCGR